MIFELNAGGGGVVIDVRQEELARLVPLMFPAYVNRVPGTPPSQPVHIVVDQQARGIAITRSNDAPVVAASVAEMVDELEYIITEALLGTLAARPHLHASGVTAASSLIALGDSGAGKSSLALAWSMAGLPVLGDDVIPLGRDATAIPFKRLFKVERGALETHGIEPDQTPLWFGDPDELWFDPAPHGGWSEPSRVDHVALIKRCRNSPVVVEPLGPGEGLAGLVHGLLDTGAPAETGFDHLLDLARHARFHRVLFESSIDAAAVLADLAR